ncbi:MAG TPA: hypothetical protein VH592_00450 [Gemmataceae bacterium]
MSQRSIHTLKTKQKAGCNEPKADSGGSKAAEAVQIAVHEHCLLHYGTSYVGGEPYRIRLPNVDVWVVPALLTSPGYGVVGNVGMVVVDAATGAVVSATPQEQVRAAGMRLSREKRHELEAAFRRARKA